MNVYELEYVHPHLDTRLPFERVPSTAFAFGNRATIFVFLAIDRVLASYCVAW
jgi:hypothetical protein